MSLEITAYAPTRESAIAFLTACNIAKADANGVIIPIADVHIHPFRPNEEISIPNVPGWHWNMRFYGQSEITLRKPEPEGGWLPEHDVFDRTYIRELVQGRTGKIPGWVASADDPVPPGYQNSDSVRLYDPALIATRSNVWA